VRDDIDEKIMGVEQATILETMKEVLWGGQTREGLAYIVAQITTQMKELTSAVRSIIKDINDPEGVRSEVRDLKNEIVRLRKNEERLDRLETIKSNISDVERLAKNNEKIIDEIKLNIVEVDKKINDRSNFTFQYITTWAAIIISTVISLVSLYQGMRLKSP